MPNPNGTKGNRNGGRKGHGQELQIARLKNLCVNWAITQIETGKDNAVIKDIVLRVLSNAVPKEITPVGDESRPIYFQVVQKVKE